MKKTPAKSLLHPRNRYQGQYDLPALCRLNPALSQWLITTPAGKTSVDFSHPHAVKALNQGLLKQYYDIDWQLPDGYLCPPIPGRADYLHFIADLLAKDAGGTIPRQADLLDIGCGANCIYPLIGHAEYGWRFTGSEVSADSLRLATALIAANPGMKRAIRLRRQKDPSAIFQGVILKSDAYALTMCNPPFHRSAQEAQQGSDRKHRNLGLDTDNGLNFAGQHHELWCAGGERGFVEQMINESQLFSVQVVWFTTLISKKENLKPLTAILKRAAVSEQRVIEMGQGNKQSRILAWTFKTPEQRARILKNTVR